MPNPDSHRHVEASTGRLQQLAGRVADACGFLYVPPVRLRRGAGGDWSPERKAIRVGSKDVATGGQRLWYTLAHELAHAQAESGKGHSAAFWRTLAGGLGNAGHLSFSDSTSDTAKVRCESHESMDCSICHQGEYSFSRSATVSWTTRTVGGRSRGGFVEEGVLSID